MDREPLENQLFSWEKWDDHGTGNLSFYGVELKVPVGEFPAGTKFPFAFWNAELSWVAFVTEDEKEYAYELKVSVGDKMETPQQEVCEDEHCHCH